MISEKAEYWIWLANALGYNHPIPYKLHQLYPNIEEFAEGGEREWRFSGVLNSAQTEKLSEAKLSDAKPIIERCKQLGYSVITPDDDSYPEKLRNIYAPPAVLYVKGHTDVFDNNLIIGIVGTRTASSYGTTNSYQFGYALGKCGVATVSGGALGVDCAAHRGSLAAGGVTICVRGCGINYNYLPDNAKMREAITQNGAVISEYPPDEGPRSYYFPARNRIIAGLCDGLVLMESGQKSGSLITADLALDMGKEVFALLGNNSPRNKGSNDRIKEGSAQPVTDFMDVLAAFGSRYSAQDEVNFDDICLADIEAIPTKRRRLSKKEPAFVEENIPVKKPPKKAAAEKTAEKPTHKKDLDLDKIQQKVYDYLSATPVHIDAIAADLQLPVFKVLSTLTALEIKGLAQAHPGRNFTLK